MDQWVFGCDICQDVCPWNRFSKPHNEPDFFPKQDLLAMKEESWYAIKEEEFNNLFEGSAVKRTGYNGLMRNLLFLK